VIATSLQQQITVEGSLVTAGAKVQTKLHNIKRRVVNIYYMNCIIISWCY